MGLGHSPRGGWIRAVVLCAVACLAVAGCGAPEDTESNDMLFGKKQEASPTTVNPDVGADLRPTDSFPGGREPSTGEGPGAALTKVRIDGVPPEATLAVDPQAPTSNAGFIVPGDTSLALLNDPEALRFDVWTLTSEMRPGARMGGVALAEDQSSWVGFHVTDAASLPGGRVLITVNRYTPRPSPALFVFDPRVSDFQLLAEVDPDIRDPWRHVRVGRISAEAALAVYATGRTRKAAEIYYNRYNHLVLFTGRYPDGIEIVKLGIDDGNVDDWVVRDGILYLLTRDARDPDNVRERYWSLDISRVLVT